MAPLVITRSGQWVDAAGNIHAGASPDAFVSGLAGDGVTRQRGTCPTPDNTGVTGTLRPYSAAIDGSTSGGILTITQPGRTITGVDFGNVKVRVRAPNVTLENCRWTITSFGANEWAVDWRHPE